MSGTKPIPIRFSPEMLERLDRAALSSGLENRTAVVKLCVQLFLRMLEENNYQIPGFDLAALIKNLDGRTHRYKKHDPPTLLVAESRPEYGAKKGKPK